MTSTVITGIGVASSIGLSTEQYWKAARNQVGGIRRISRFDPESYPARLAGEITGFAVEEHLPSRLISQTDRMTQLALMSAESALTDAGIKPEDLGEYDVGVVTAASSGGFEFGQGELESLWSKGGQYVSAYQSFAWFYAVNSGQISIRHGMRGPSGVVVSDGAGGLDALAQARRQLRKGTRVIVSGGFDADICPWGWVAQLAGKRLSTSDDPERAYLPFDAAAHGHVPAEGGALLILEQAEVARERGARIYGELAGYGATFDPAPGSGRPPGLARAIRMALADAGVEPGEVDVVFADAAAIPALDRAEAEALREVFGAGGVPVTTPKTMTGRLCSGAGALDVATALLAIRDNEIPCVTHTEPVADLGLDLVTGRSRSLPVSTALVLARGYGGFNSAAVVRRFTNEA